MVHFATGPPDVLKFITGCCVVHFTTGPPDVLQFITGCCVVHFATGPPDVCYSSSLDVVWFISLQVP